MQNPIHHPTPTSSGLNSIGSFSNSDVGSPKIEGIAKPNGSGWDIFAGGVDIWEAHDEFHFVFQERQGDFDISVRIETFIPAHLYSKAGLMVRENLTSTSAHLMLVVFSKDEVRNNNIGIYEMQFRSKDGENCQAIYPAVLPPTPPEFPASYPNTWLRIQRVGNQFSAFGSTDGQTWKLYAIKDLPMAESVFIGPALTSHNTEAVASAVFKDFTNHA